MGNPERAWVMAQLGHREWDPFVFIDAELEVRLQDWPYAPGLSTRSISDPEGLLLAQPPNPCTTCHPSEYVATPGVHMPRARDEDAFAKVLNGIQRVLDWAGFVPGFGELADGVNAMISGLRGDYLGAALSIVSMVPGIGDVIGKGLKAGLHLVPNRAIEVLRSVGASGLQLARGMMERLHAFASGLREKFMGLITKLRFWRTIGADIQARAQSALGEAAIKIGEALDEIAAMIDQAIGGPQLVPAGAGGAPMPRVAQMDHTGNGTRGAAKVVDTALRDKLVRHITTATQKKFGGISGGHTEAALMALKMRVGFDKLAWEVVDEFKGAQRVRVSLKRWDTNANVWTTDEFEKTLFPASWTDADLLTAAAEIASRGGPKAGRAEVIPVTIRDTTLNIQFLPGDPPSMFPVF